MKKMILGFAITLALTTPVQAKMPTVKTTETKSCSVMTVKTVKKKGKYVSKVYWKGKKITSFKFKKKPKVKFINTDKLTTKKLVNRKDKTLYIEVMSGTALNKKGDGRVDTKDPYYNYISYNGIKGIKKGSRIRTFCIYNPYNNYEDDIVERYDEFIK